MLYICGIVPTPKSTSSNPNLAAPLIFSVDAVPFVPFVNVNLLVPESYFTVIPPPTVPAVFSTWFILCCNDYSDVMPEIEK